MAVWRLAWPDWRNSATRSWFVGRSWQTAHAVTSYSLWSGVPMERCWPSGPWQLSHCMPARAFTLLGIASHDVDTGAAVTWSYVFVTTAPFSTRVAEVGPVSDVKTFVRSGKLQAS